MSVRKQNIPENDDFQTPKEAWELIEKYIDLKDKVIWCPFWMEGDITWDHKQLIHRNEDFFQAPIPLLHDCIVDNPPYSIKEKVLNRCLELGDPFALLLPIDTLERKYFIDTILMVETIRRIAPSNPVGFALDLMNLRRE